MSGSKGKPIPKILGRGKNKEIPRRHSYHLRTRAVTRCQSTIQDGTGCTFCHHTNSLKQNVEQENRKIKTELLKITIRCLVTERWKRQREEKIKTLRGILNGQSEELRLKELDVLQHQRDARDRKSELQNCTSQLKMIKDENVSLRNKLDSESHKYELCQEILVSRTHENSQLKIALKSLMDLLKPLVEEQNLGSVDDSESSAARMKSIKDLIDRSESLVLSDASETAESIQMKSNIVNKILVEVICSVCQDMFIDPVALPCGHTFCEYCVRTWFRRCRACPVCRFKILSNAQLHAVYQFRQIVTILEPLRKEEEQKSRESEKSRRLAVRDELYVENNLHNNYPSRRTRDRYYFRSNDRLNERYHTRRRRVDEMSPVPYPTGRPPVPPQQTENVSFIEQQNQHNVLINQQSPSYLIQIEPTSTIVQSSPNSSPQRSLIESFLDGTIGTIDRFLRGDRSPGSGTSTPPLQAIEYTPLQQSPESSNATTPTLAQTAVDDYPVENYPVTPRGTGGEMTDDNPSHPSLANSPSSLEPFGSISPIIFSNEEVYEGVGEADPAITNIEGSIRNPIVISDTTLPEYAANPTPSPDASSEDPWPNSPLSPEPNIVFVPRDTSLSLPNSDLNEDNTRRLIDGEFLSGSSSSSLNGDDPDDDASENDSLTARSQQTETLSISDTTSTVSSGEMEQEALSLYQDRNPALGTNEPSQFGPSTIPEDEVPLISADVSVEEASPDERGQSREYNYGSGTPQTPTDTPQTDTSNSVEDTTTLTGDSSTLPVSPDDTTNSNSLEDVD